MGLPLRKNIRFYVLLGSVVLGLAALAQTWNTIDDGTLRIIRLTQYYGLLAMTYLYLALLIGPLVYAFPALPWRGYIYRSRRAVGVSAYFFGLTHGVITFWGQLGGFAGLPFLPTNYLIGISLSFTALVILSLMAATSFDKMVQYLGMKRWKLLHRFVYLAAMLVLIHALMIGTHFADIISPTPQLFSIAVFFLLTLEANRFDAYLTRVFVWPKKIPITLAFLVVLTAIYYGWLFLR